MTVPSFQIRMPPPKLLVTLPVTVELIRVISPPYAVKMPAPPKEPVPWFSTTVQRFKVTAPNLFEIPPPASVTILFGPITQSVRIRVLREWL